jgi:hypothetical protein
MQQQVEYVSRIEQRTIQKSERLRLFRWWWWWNSSRKEHHLAGLREATLDGAVYAWSIGERHSQQEWATNPPGSSSAPATLSRSHTPHFSGGSHKQYERSKKRFWHCAYVGGSRPFGAYSTSHWNWNREPKFIAEVHLLLEWCHLIYNHSYLESTWLKAAAHWLRTTGHDV